MTEEYCTFEKDETAQSFEEKVALKPVLWWQLLLIQYGNPQSNPVLVQLVQWTVDQVFTC